MKAVVVYESHWGNTAEIAHAIAEGIGPDTTVLPTDQAEGAALEDLDLLVVGAPVVMFGLPGERAEEAILKAVDPPAPPDVSHPSLRTWLDSLPRGHAEAAAFETRVRWSPGGATRTIERGLERAGYRTNANSGKFIVAGRYGPLRAGELDRARRWGAALAARVSAG